MIIAYDSMTGNVKRFIHKLNLEGYEFIDIRKSPLEKVSNYILITHTFLKGQVPDTTLKFTEINPSIIGVMSSGSYHWGDNFGKAGDIISHTYKVPLIGKFNKSGTQQDVEILHRWINELD